MSELRIGSLFSGVGGLDMAVEAVFGGTVVWHSEIDPAASKVLAHRYPNTINFASSGMACARSRRLLRCVPYSRSNNAQADIRGTTTERYR